MNLDTFKDLLLTLDHSSRSRKFLLTIGALVLITIFGLIGIRYSSIEGIYPTFIGGVIGIVSIYLTGNVASKYVVGKNIIAAQEVQNKATTQQPISDTLEE